jgi:hypothetical protein
MTLHEAGCYNKTQFEIIPLVSNKGAYGDALLPQVLPLVQMCNKKNQTLM